MRRVSEGWGLEAGDPEVVARSVSERGELVLRRRQRGSGPPSLELRANGVFVMDSVEITSEVALARAALALIDTPDAVLVGGLGLGYTLDAVLADSRVGTCAVVEIDPTLVNWMRDGTIPHGPRLLADHRVTTVVADIAAALSEATPGGYDVVLLDVDNGPGYLVHAHNAVLYDASLLTQVHRVLRPGGIVAIWSAAEAPELERTLRGVFGGAESRSYDVDLQGRSEKYWLILARR